MSKQAVIFDMDGVIVDSEPRHKDAFHRVIEDIGFAGRHTLRFDDYVGRSDTELWVDFVTKHKPDQSLEELLRMKRERVIEILRQEQPVFKGLKSLVAGLAPRYHLALASGSERAVVETVWSLNSYEFSSRSVSAARIYRVENRSPTFS